MSLLSEAKTILPCLHVWQWEEREDGNYFVCANCHKALEYNPEDLNDIESEIEK